MPPTGDGIRVLRSRSVHLQQQSPSSECGHNSRSSSSAGRDDISNTTIRRHSSNNSSPTNDGNHNDTNNCPPIKQEVDAVDDYIMPKTEPKSPSQSQEDRKPLLSPPPFVVKCEALQPHWGPSFLQMLREQHQRNREQKYDTKTSPVRAVGSTAAKATTSDDEDDPDKVIVAPFRRYIVPSRPISSVIVQLYEPQRPLLNASSVVIEPLDLMISWRSGVQRHGIVSRRPVKCTSVRNYSVIVTAMPRATKHVSGRSGSSAAWRPSTDMIGDYRHESQIRMTTLPPIILTEQTISFDTPSPMVTSLQPPLLGQPASASSNGAAAAAAAAVAAPSRPPTHSVSHHSVSATEFVRSSDSESTLSAIDDSDSPSTPPDVPLIVRSMPPRLRPFRQPSSSSSSSSLSSPVPAAVVQPPSFLDTLHIPDGITIMSASRKRAVLPSTPQHPIVIVTAPPKHKRNGGGSSDGTGSGGIVGAAGSGDDSSSSLADYLRNHQNEGSSGCGGGAAQASSSSSVVNASRIGIFNFPCSKGAVSSSSTMTSTTACNGSTTAAPRNNTVIFSTSTTTCPNILRANCRNSSSSSASTRPIMYEQTTRYEDYEVCKEMLIMPLPNDQKHPQSTNIKSLSLPIAGPSPPVRRHLRSSTRG